MMISSSSSSSIRIGASGRDVDFLRQGSHVQAKRAAGLVLRS